MITHSEGGYLSRMPVTSHL